MRRIATEVEIQVKNLRARLDAAEARAAAAERQELLADRKCEAMRAVVEAARVIIENRERLLPDPDPERREKWWRTRVGKSLYDLRAALAAYDELARSGDV